MTKVCRSLIGDDTLAGLDGHHAGAPQTPRMQLICFGESSFSEVRYSLPNDACLHSMVRCYPREIKICALISARPPKSFFLVNGWMNDSET
jgi:hypothetical protein